MQSPQGSGEHRTSTWKQRSVMTNIRFTLYVVALVLVLFAARRPQTTVNVHDVPSRQLRRWAFLLGSILAFVVATNMYYSQWLIVAFVATAALVMVWIMIARVRPLRGYSNSFLGLRTSESDLASESLPADSSNRPSGSGGSSTSRYRTITDTTSVGSMLASS